MKQEGRLKIFFLFSFIASFPSARCKIAVVRIGTFSLGGLVVGQFITDQDEQ